jgi:hypothetical protein
MTPDQIRLVQESFRSVVPICDEAARIFYDRLFALDPALRPLFWHADMSKQGCPMCVPWRAAMSVTALGTAITRPSGRH